MSELRRCVRCRMPETKDSLTFDEEGVCSVCRQHEYKHHVIDWNERKKELDALIEAYRGKYAYDCVVPFGGGKDGAYTLYYLVKEYKLKPLAAHFDHGFTRPRASENIVKTLKKLGVDYSCFRPNWQVVRRLMLESLKCRGNFCWHCLAGIHAYPIHLAVRYQVPLVIWSHPMAESSSYYSYADKEEVDEQHFLYETLNVTADDMLKNLPDVDPRDMEIFRLPSHEDRMRLGIRSLFLGNYIPWNGKEQAHILSQELGWQGEIVEGVPPGYEYDKTDCYLQGVRDYLTYVTRGYGRTAQITATEVQLGRMSPEEAQRLTEKYDGKRPASLDLFLKQIGVDEEEFLDIVTPHSSWQFDYSKVEFAPPVHDMDQWR